MTRNCLRQLLQAQVIFPVVLRKIPGKKLQCVKCILLYRNSFKCLFADSSEVLQASPIQGSPSKIRDNDSNYILGLLVRVVTQDHNDLLVLWLRLRRIWITVTDLSHAGIRTRTGLFVVHSRLYWQEEV